MKYSWGAHLIGGIGGTILLTTLMSVSRGLRLTRISIPFMVGTLFTSNRDRAQWTGILVHLLIGYLFAFFYFGFFMLHPLNSYWALGTLIGFLHGLFILSAGMSVLPSIHPRMATERRGPIPTRLLEPPGFLALHYGRGTPAVTIIAHMIYGASLGICFGSG
jgi:hypothetical protein